MATSRKGGQGGGKSGKATKPKSLMSPKNMALYALNDILTVHADDAEPSAEVVAGRKVLADLKFEQRPSRAQELQAIEDEIKGIDASQPGAAARMVEMGKRLSAVQRGQVKAKKAAAA
jgi:hypothetical protein